VASQAGYLPLEVMMVVMAIVSAFSGLYIAESVLADNEYLHLPRLARKHLGAWGFMAMLLAILIYIY
jgi:amino acid permease